jgi:acetylornithine deacetylase/succinyl-diaminopimelate desuccinylase-like protein
MAEMLDRLMGMVEDSSDELVELLQALVRIPTINTGAPDSGNEIEACRLLEERFKAEGIPSLVLESAPSRGNLLAYIGNDTGPRLLLMSHIDVVPVDATRWERPPFSGEIVDGKVWGRGSDDCKSLVAAGTMALVLLKRAGVSLKGELRMVAGADEEAGGWYGIGWLAENHPDEIRADWAVNEGGGLPLKTPAGGANYLVSIGEKGRMEAHFSFNGRSGHAARPWTSDNALFKVSQLVERIRARQPDLDVSLPVFEPLRLYGIEEAPTPENIERLLMEMDKIDPVVAAQLKAHTQMTLVPTMASAGLKANNIPATASLTCDIRNLPHQDEAYVRRELEKLMAGIEGVDLRLEATGASNASPYDSPFVNQLQRATALALGREDVNLVPGMSTGMTDSRHVRPLGTQAYGYAPLDPSLDTARTGVHGINEAFAIDSLVLRTKMQIALAYLVLGGQ